jgi:hypothetical protein
LRIVGPRVNSPAQRYARAAGLAGAVRLHAGANQWKEVAIGEKRIGALSEYFVSVRSREGRFDRCLGVAEHPLEGEGGLAAQERFLEDIGRAEGYQVDAAVDSGADLPALGKLQVPAGFD